MKQLPILFAAVTLVFSAHAYDVTPEQAAKLCKVTDQSLLHQLPTLMELKNAGMSKRDLLIVGARANHYEGIMRYANWPAREAIGALYDEHAPVKTADEAIQWIEARCVRDLRS